MQLIYPRVAFYGVPDVFCVPAVAGVPKVTGAIADGGVPVYLLLLSILAQNDRANLTMGLLQSKLSLVSDRRYTVEKLISISD